jgi:hypothetical protein
LADARILAADMAERCWLFFFGFNVHGFAPSSSLFKSTVASKALSFAHGFLILASL